MSQSGKMEVIKLNMRVESVEGFSGHSDRRQLLNFVQKMTPKPSRILVGHGEARKCEDIAQVMSKTMMLRASAPQNLETIRLR